MTTYKEITGFPGYFIRNDGTVWTNKNLKNDGIRGMRQLTLYRRPYGARYMVIGLRPGPKEKLRILYVHRLVAQAFIGPGVEGQVVCHNDGDTSNNRKENLRWGSRLENAADSVRHGTSPRGERHFNARLKEHQVLEAFEMRRQGASHRQIASSLGITEKYVGAILNRRSWRHLRVS